MHDYVQSFKSGLSDTNIIYLATKLMNFHVNYYTHIYRQY